VTTASLPAKILAAFVLGTVLLLGVPELLMTIPAMVPGHTGESTMLADDNPGPINAT
jgi:hypothetical protein